MLRWDLGKYVGLLHLPEPAVNTQRELINSCRHGGTLDISTQIRMLSQPHSLPLRHSANALPTVDLQCCQISVSFSCLRSSLCLIPAKDFPDNCHRVSRRPKNQSLFILLLPFFPPIPFLPLSLSPFFQPIPLFQSLLEQNIEITAARAPGRVRREKKRSNNKASQNPKV